MTEKRGLFITFEGGEGSGKTTIIDQLADALNARGAQLVKTRNPGGTPLGQQVRHWLLNCSGGLELSPRAELMLFLADRVQHLDSVVLPALAAGKIVLCDRYNDSSIAYQGGGRGLGVDAVAALCDEACGHVVPDVTFYFDTDPAIGLARSRAVAKEEADVGAVDRIESEALAFHARVRAVMQQLARHNPDRIITIDASAQLGIVYNRVYAHISKVLQSHGSLLSSDR